MSTRVEASSLLANHLAIKRVSDHLQAIPDHSGLHSYYGTVLATAGQVERAEAAYLKAISLNDRNLGAYLGLGNLYRERGRTNEAIAQYEAALVKDPRLNSARLNLALIYEQKNDYDKAQSLYTQILTQDLRFAPAANNLAFLLMKRGGNIDVALLVCSRKFQTISLLIRWSSIISEWHFSSPEISRVPARGWRSLWRSTRIIQKRRMPKQLQPQSDT